MEKHNPLVKVSLSHAKWPPKHTHNTCFLLISNPFRIIQCQGSCENDTGLGDGWGSSTKNSYEYNFLGLRNFGPDDEKPEIFPQKMDYETAVSSFFGVKVGYFQKSMEIPRGSHSVLIFFFTQ